MCTLQHMLIAATSNATFEGVATPLAEKLAQIVAGYSQITAKVKCKIVDG